MLAKIQRVGAFFMLPLALLIWPAVASAQSGTWTVDGTGLWGTASNWTGGAIADGAGNTADFSAVDITADRTVRVDTARTIGNLIFGDTATATAAGWILDNNGVASNTLTLAGTTPTITVNALGAGKGVTISTKITGSSGLTKDGPGTLQLANAANNYGKTIVKGGMIEFKNGALGPDPASFQSDFLTLDGGTVKNLEANKSAYFTTKQGITLGAGGGTFIEGVSFVNIGGVISGTGNLTVSNTVGEFRIGSFNGNNTTSTNTFTGDTILAVNSAVDLVSTCALFNSTLDLSAAGAQARFLNNASYILGGLKGSQNMAVAQKFNNNALVLAIGNNNQDTTYGGVLSGAGSIVKIGTGTLTLTGGNTYTGSTTIAAGTLQVGNGGTSGSLSPNSAIINNATLIFNRSNTITQGVQFASAISGSGALTKAGAGTLILSGTNTYAGVTTISAGTLQLNGVLTGAGGVIICSNATLSGTGAVNGSVVVNAGGNLQLGTSTNSLGLTVGSLTLAENATWPCLVSETTNNVAHVMGTLTLPAHLTVAVTKVSGPDPTRTLVLFDYSAGNCQGATDLSNWTVTGLEGYTCRLDTTGKRVTLVPPDHGGPVFFVK